MEIIFLNVQDTMMQQGRNRIKMYVKKNVQTGAAFEPFNECRVSDLYNMDGNRLEEESGDSKKIRNEKGLRVPCFTRSGPSG